MADLYWNAPSSPAYYTDAANWRVGSVSGPVSSTAPTASDSIWFSSSSSLIGCEFNSHVNVTSFTADDPNGTFTLGPLYTNNLEITVTGTFDIQFAGNNQKSIFALLNAGFDDAAVNVYMQPSAGGSAYVLSGGNQLGGVIVNGSTTGTVYLYANQGGTINPFKCYVLQIDSGIASFSEPNCNGLHLGYPGSAPLYTVLKMYTSVYRKLDAQFPSSKPIIMYGGCQCNTAAGITYDLVWANDTQIHVRGYATTVSLSVAPVPAAMGAPQSPRKLPYVYNYLGENASGAAVGSGGNLIISAIYVGGSNACPVYMQGLTCTAAGSVSGFFNRSVEIYVDYPTIRYTYIEIPGTGSTNTSVLNLAGAPSYPVTLRNRPGVPSGTSYRGRLKFYNTVTPNVTTTYTTITGIEAESMSGGQYLAYTINGNVDGGNNLGWTFEQAQSGFLAFFS